MCGVVLAVVISKAVPPAEHYCHETWKVAFRSHPGSGPDGRGTLRGEFCDLGGRGERWNSKRRVQPKSRQITRHLFALASSIFCHHHFSIQQHKAMLAASSLLGKQAIARSSSRESSWLCRIHRWMQVQLQWQSRLLFGRGGQAEQWRYIDASIPDHTC